MTTPDRLGDALRNLRRSHKWTLSDVAEKTSISISTLSKVERGQMSLTYDKLVLLADGLGVDITTFFSDAVPSPAPSAAGRRSITRKGNGQVIETPSYTYVYPNTDLLNRPFVPIIADVKARTIDEFGPLLKHSGEEFVHVLEGKVVVHTEHYAPCELNQGDSIHLDSSMGHAFTAAGPGPCRLLSICSAHEGQLGQPAIELT